MYHITKYRYRITNVCIRLLQSLGINPVSSSTVPLTSKLPLSRETRLVSLETHLISLNMRLVSREKPSKNCKYHYKVSHSAEVRNRSAYRNRNWMKQTLSLHAKNTSNCAVKQFSMNSYIIMK